MASAHVGDATLARFAVGRGVGADAPSDRLDGVLTVRGHAGPTGEQEHRAQPDQADAALLVAALWRRSALGRCATLNVAGRRWTWMVAPWIYDGVRVGRVKHGRLKLRLEQWQVGNLPHGRASQAVGIGKGVDSFRQCVAKAFVIGPGGVGGRGRRKMEHDPPVAQHRSADRGTPRRAFPTGAFVVDVHLGERDVGFVFFLLARRR